MTMNDGEYNEFKRWKADQEDRNRKRGSYWLSEEGRRDIRDVWDDPEDGNVVLPLLNALEDLERELEAKADMSRRSDVEPTPVDWDLLHEMARIGKVDSDKALAVAFEAFNAEGDLVSGVTAGVLRRVIIALRDEPGSRMKRLRNAMDVLAAPSPEPPIPNAEKADHVL